MSNSNVLSLFSVLKDIQQRLDVWVGEHPLDIVPFLYGFGTACNALGVDSLHDEIYIRVASNRGWQYYSAAGVLPSMRERQLDDLGIAKELINIEIEVWRERFGLSDE